MTADTNSSFIAREIKTEGWEITTMMSVGDSESSIARGLNYMLEVSDAVVVTGGLGPTADDITTASIAKAFDLRLYTDKAVLDGLKERFKKRNLRWTENNAKQARFPEGAGIIKNPVGSACGFFLEKGEKIVAVLPGVPGEIKRMLPESLLPILRLKFKKPGTTAMRKTIKIFGLTESTVDEVISRLDLTLPGVGIGFYPRFPDIHVVITSVSEDRYAAKENLERAEIRITEQLSKNIFAFDHEYMEDVVANHMKRKHLTLSVAESCTGGLIADRLTNVPGSSDFFERGIVSYSNASKIALLNVPRSTIARKGAVSEETALSMAKGIRETSSTDIGLSTTGIAGPTGGTPQKPVGTVYIALTDGHMRVCRKFSFGWDRRKIKEISAQWALEMLRRYLIGRDI